MLLTIYKRATLWTMLLAGMFAGGCRKFIEVPPPENLVSSATIFTNDAIATSAMVGLYSKMMNAAGLFNSHLSVFGGLCADELQRGVPFATYDVFQQNAIPANNGTVNSIWTTAYNYIYHSNAILEGLERGTGVSVPVREQLRGEALFVRALTYFYLTALFGDVPLVLTTSFDTNAFLPRSAVSQVYAQVKKDLLMAAELLPARYVSTSGFPGARVRPNHWAAKALLARLLLYEKDYPAAEAYAGEVINAGVYSLASRPDLVFLAGSPEAIWQLMPVSSGSHTADGLLFIPLSQTAVPGFVLSASLLQQFESGDSRKALWTKTQTVNTRAYTYPFKYKVRAGGAPYSEYNMVLRLAEMYLLRAECRAHQGRLAEAAADVNRIRNRASLTGLPDTSSQAVLLRAIEKERQTELFAEWGHRWFDLKRTDRADAVLSAEKGAQWQTADVLWPIPFTQMQLNYTLTQNPGY